MLCSDFPSAHQRECINSGMEYWNGGMAYKERLTSIFFVFFCTTNFHLNTQILP